MSLSDQIYLTSHWINERTTRFPTLCLDGKIKGSNLPDRTSVGYLSLDANCD